MQAYDLSAVRLLIVDDNAFMRKLVRAVVAALGLRTIGEASDGAEALRVMADRPWDLIICDLLMEPMGGIDFAHLVRRSTGGVDRQTPIIMMTSLAERRRVEQARDAGVNEFLAKPINAGSVYKRIAAVIESPRPFVQSEGYVGPCRRRRRAGADYEGPKRRWDDQADVEELML